MKAWVRERSAGEGPEKVDDTSPFFELREQVLRREAAEFGGESVVSVYRVYSDEELCGRCRRRGGAPISRHDMAPE